MADKFQNKYRISSARLQTWNYGLAASYFVTVCTDNRKHFFGEIVDGKMVLSAIGKIVENEWIKTLEIRPDMNLELDAFCVMPNHFHAIIIIGENEYNHGINAMHRVCSNVENDDTQRIALNNKIDDSQRIALNNKIDDSQRIALNNKIDDSQRRDAMHRVSTTHNKFAPQSKNLASIMRGFKSSVTVVARSIDKNFKWQTRFHDHIIRNNLAFQRIRKYIIENPQNWLEDCFYDVS